MDYVLGALAGIVIGAVVALVKGFAMWKKYINSDSDSPESESIRLYSRMIISNFINIGLLVALFFLRDVWPFNGFACMIGAAVALTVTNGIFAARQKG